VVGLVGPASILKKELERVRTWQPFTEIEADALDGAAKTMLYLDSAVQSIQYDNQSFNEDTPTEADQNRVIAKSELTQAERIVLHECIAGIQLTKRAITSYSESGFDATHIANIPKILGTVRGGLQMMKHPKAASIVDNCAQFVDQILLHSDQPAALKEMLETFADAVISVEYFFDTAEAASRLDESTLQVAEESLAALGFPTKVA